jgi:hypothetical protein
MHPVRGLKYRKHVVFKNPKLEFHNVVEYDVRPKFEVFSQLSLPQAREYLSRILVDSAAVLEKHRNKFPNFDTENFVQDLRVCLLV